MITNTSLWAFRIAFALSIIIALVKQEAEMFIVSAILLVCLFFMEVVRSRYD